MIYLLIAWGSLLGSFALLMTIDQLDRAVARRQTVGRVRRRG